MSPRFVLPVLVAAWLATPALVSAQTVSAEVKLNFPVNLTQLGPDVQKVKVTCAIISDAITAGTSGVLSSASGGRWVEQSAEFPATGGLVSTNAILTFSLTGLDNPVGKNASISCILVGWSVAEQKWNFFNTAATNVSFRTTTNVPTLQSSFVW